MLLLTTTEALLANVEVFLIALPQENRKDLNGFDTCTFLRKAIDVIHSLLLTLHAWVCYFFGKFFGFCEKVFSNSSIRLQIRGIFVKKWKFFRPYLLMWFWIFLRRIDLSKISFLPDLIISEMRWQEMKSFLTRFQWQVSLTTPMSVKDVIQAPFSWMDSFKSRRISQCGSKNLWSGFLKIS